MTDELETYKDTIIRLYQAENMTLEEVMERMREFYNVRKK